MATTCPIAGPVALRWIDGRDHVAFVVAENADDTVDLIAFLIPAGDSLPAKGPGPEMSPIWINGAYLRCIPRGVMEGTEPRPSWYEPGAYPLKHGGG